MKVAAIVNKIKGIDHLGRGKSKYTSPKPGPKAAGLPQWLRLPSYLLKRNSAWLCFCFACHFTYFRSISSSKPMCQYNSLGARNDCTVALLPQIPKRAEHPDGSHSCLSPGPYNPRSIVPAEFARLNAHDPPAHLTLAPHSSFAAFVSAHYLDGGQPAARLHGVRPAGGPSETLGHAPGHRARESGNQTPHAHGPPLSQRSFLIYSFGREPVWHEAKNRYREQDGEIHCQNYNPNQC